MAPVSKKYVFSDRRNPLYDKSACCRCDGRLLVRVQQLQMLYHQSITVHVRLTVERSRHCV